MRRFNSGGSLIRAGEKLPEKEKPGLNLGFPPLFGVSEGVKIRPSGKLRPDLQSVGGKAAAAATTTAAGFHCGCRAGVKRHRNGNIVIPVIASGVPGRGFSPSNIFDFHLGHLNYLLYGVRSFTVIIFYHTLCDTPMGDYVPLRVHEPGGAIVPNCCAGYP